MIHTTHTNSDLTHPRGEPVARSQARECAADMRLAMALWIRREIADEMEERRACGGPSIEHSIYAE
jgi:hypothetical protein